MAIAFFDLDRTLLDVNAGSLWVRAELRAGYLNRWQATRAAAWIFGYHLGYSKMERVLAEGVATLRDQSEADVQRRTDTFYHAEVASRFRKHAAEKVEFHREQGHHLALLTSSSNYLAAPVQAALGIPHVLCNRFLVASDGRFTGQPQLPWCFGVGKVHHAERLAEHLHEDLADAWFYTDSASDLPVMERVGHPVAVHPDPRLRRVASARGWEVQNWDRP